MDSAPLVELVGVRKVYRLGSTEVAALQGVDFRAERGEFTSLVGPSGSGKTTLLNVIGCLDTPTSGDVRLDGESVVGRDPDELAEIRNRKIGFIFQSFNLIPVLDVLENVEFPCLLGSRRMSRADSRERAREAAHAVGLDPFLRHRPDELSGGQRQRVAIARALATRPELVLADEPTANLDSATAEQILELMLSLNRERSVTFLFSTHDSRIVKHARRIVVLQDGRIAPGGTA